MRILTSLALAAVVLSGVAAGTARAAAPPTPVPDMKPDLSAMALFMGTWNCSSTTRAAHRTNTTTTTMDYDGRWMKSHDVAPPFDKYRTRAVITDSWVTYNADTKQWVSTSVDNFGGYGIVTSPGWHGNTLVWTTEIAQGGVTGVDTLTKVSPTETKDTFIGKTKSGKSVPPVTTTCIKGN